MNRVGVRATSNCSPGCCNACPVEMHVDNLLSARHPLGTSHSRSVCRCDVKQINKLAASRQLETSNRNISTLNRA